MESKKTIRSDGLLTALLQSDYNMADKEKEKRVRNWCFLQYDDSSPDDWRDKISALYVKWVESPLHDKDENEDGSLKKPHRHIGLMFSGKKSFSQIKEISDLVSGVKPEPIRGDMSAFVRYCAHLDHPDKYQYLTKDIIGHCGFSVEQYLTFSTNEELLIVRDIEKWITENHFVTWKDFSDRLLDEHLEEWGNIAMKKYKTPLFQYIRSIQWADEKKEKDIERNIKLEAYKGKIESDTLDAQLRWAKRLKYKFHQSNMDEIIDSLNKEIDEDEEKKKMVHEKYYEDDEK